MTQANKTTTELAKTCAKLAAKSHRSSHSKVFFKIAVPHKLAKTVEQQL